MSKIRSPSVGGTSFSAPATGARSSSVSTTSRMRLADAFALDIIIKMRFRPITPIRIILK